MADRQGGCSCGQLRFIVQGDPLRVGVCHCLDCRKHHGALFFAAAVFAENTVKITGRSASHKGRHICPDCGSSVYAVSGGEVELHLGAFDAPDQFTPTYELWTDRRDSWLTPISGAAQHARARDADN
ncbi:MAG: GFA family protein [Yoonia sp.]|nr:GFA family protein [Yoonia sp.]